MTLISSDGIGVGVMLEIARVLVERNEPIDGSIIFRELAMPRISLMIVWNGAEGLWYPAGIC